MVYPQGQIITDLLNNENGTCVYKAIIKDNEGNILGTGHAYEKEGSSFINKTSYIENCETSAVGRALGMVGFGIDTSVASAEEVANAIQQQDSDKLIDKKMMESLNKAIENAKIQDDVVELILSQYGYSNTAEIKIKDYVNIVNDFKAKK